MTVPEPVGPPKEIRTRFLYPFFFDRGKLKQASQALSEATVAAGDGRPMTIWERHKPPALYQEELLDHVDRFLLGDDPEGKYLRLAGALSSRWFNKLRIILSEPKPSKREAVESLIEIDRSAKREHRIQPVGLADLASVEVFLSNYGAGILSIALTPALRDLDCESAALFNYKLSQLRPQVSAKLRIPHPSENPQIWERMPAQQKERLASIPTPDTPIRDRLGFAGGSFTLSELIVDVLLEPLRGIGLSPVQGQLSVYTVVRFGEEVDFEREGIRAALAPFLAGLSQIQEPNHAGATTGSIGGVSAILNRRHWMSVGLLGIAHIVSDQPAEESSFNEQRVPRAFTKYFIPYLLGLLQRTTLHRTIRDASKLVLTSEHDSVTGLTALRKHMLEFALDGYFPEVSSREVIHLYYRLIHEGLGVCRAFEDARRAISDIDVQHTVDRQMKLAEAMAENAAATNSLQRQTNSLQEQMTEHLGVVAKVQMSIEWIEIFLVSVYMAHLWDLFASHVKTLEPWTAYGVIAAAIMGAIGAAAVLRPWRHRKSKGH